MYQHLADCHTVLISGCGGGYDLFCGLDLFFNLHDQGKHIVFGSYTFTEDSIVTKFGQKITDHCYRITNQIRFNEAQIIETMRHQYKKPPPEMLEQMGYQTYEEYVLSLFGGKSETPKIYFPEYKLVKYLHDQYQIDVSVYCFVDDCVKSLIESYRRVIDLEQIDCIVLVDGGTDSLMTGAEHGALGTPFEDVSSLLAVNQTGLKHQYLYCLGYNIDRFHGVTDQNYLKNTAQLIRDNQFMGSYMLTKQSQSTQKYIDTFMHCDPENSIVNTVVVLAINGEFGPVCPEWMKYRLKGSELEIHPLMSLYWIYDLKGVCHNLKYNKIKLIQATNAYEVSQLLKL